jgi:RNA polymerase sigma factor (sigma-70 family)
MAFKNGSTDAFDTLYRKYVQDLYNYGRKFTADADLVRDCIHNLFLELWNSRQSLDDVFVVKFYLFRGIRRKLIRAISQKSTMRNLPPQEAFEITLPYETLWIETQSAEEYKLHLLHTINQLSKRQREAIFLKYYENLSYEEVAEVMSVHIHTVYNLISLAIGKLREPVSKISFTLAFLGTFLPF